MEESSSGSDSSNASGSDEDGKNSSMVTGEDHSTFLDKSSVEIEADDELNAEVLDDIFPGMQTELLLIVTYEQIIFVENAKRDKAILEIKLEDLLYVMGKNDNLKIGFQLNQNILNKEQ